MDQMRLWWKERTHWIFDMHKWWLTVPFTETGKSEVRVVLCQGSQFVLNTLFNNPIRHSSEYVRRNKLLYSNIWLLLILNIFPFPFLWSYFLFCNLFVMCHFTLEPFILIILSGHVIFVTNRCIVYFYIRV